ncbi:cytochrome c-type biogenesis protein CcmH [Roseinatronobacter thiooxidans]|uniref:Cytochrome c-type biogenesis protein CcmH n=1 Tax=Roseinatronobacter thiooxidans TaxID=121821 RepID=A0A2W7S2J8_9RHOB|nr:c-type cytochrome biogenesis protein CcmI [Roseinatronobacter thiooxidans]PZX44622.1 cytochrome c-type biogenesis protein CcmH [Roseinatronobacter thiooxidans]
MSFTVQTAGFFIIALLVGAILLRAMSRAGQAVAADGTERAMRVYRDQITEIDRDLARGTINETEAERLRLEVSRRILELDKSDRGRPVGGPAPRTMRAVAFALIVVAVAGSGLLYLGIGAPGYSDMPLLQRHADAAEARQNRPRQAEMEAEFAAAFPEPEDFPGRAELEPMVAQLRAALDSRPLDVTGFGLLAQNEARLGNFRAAIEAQVRVIELKEDEAGVEDYAYLLDLMVIATGGFVSPEAETIIEQILRRDTSNTVALYYSGRMYAQTGRPDMTFRVWRRLHDLSPGDAPWMPEIRAALPELARISGEPRYQLPPRPAPAGARGPSEMDLDAVQDMPPEDRAQMIEDMVGGLSARLANEGGSAEEWAQLIRALGVLGRDEQAVAVLQEARTVFAARAEDLALINATAEAAGLSTPAP